MPETLKQPFFGVFFYFSKGKCLVPGLDLTLLHRVPKISKNGSKKCYATNIDGNLFFPHIPTPPVRLRCSAQKDPIDKLESKMRNWRNLFHQDLNISTPHPKDTTERTYISLVGDISFLAPVFMDKILHHPGGLKNPCNSMRF